jgi:hypothetical protein
LPGAGNGVSKKIEIRGVLQNATSVSSASPGCNRLFAVSVRDARSEVSTSARLQWTKPSRSNGNFVYFDNATDQIGLHHVMASGSLPSGFPATCRLPPLRCTISLLKIEFIV